MQVVALISVVVHGRWLAESLGCVNWWHSAAHYLWPTPPSSWHSSSEGIFAWLLSVLDYMMLMQLNVACSLVWSPWMSLIDALSHCLLVLPSETELPNSIMCWVLWADCRIPCSSIKSKQWRSQTTVGFLRGNCISGESFVWVCASYLFLDLLYCFLVQEWNTWGCLWWLIIELLTLWPVAWLCQKVLIMNWGLP